MYLYIFFCSAFSFSNTEKAFSPKLTRLSIDF